MESNPRRKYYLDASLFKESLCLNKIKKILIEGWSSKEVDWRIEYGTAFHKFAEAFNSGVEKNVAKLLAINYYGRDEIQAQIGNDYRTLNHLMLTCDGYARTYPFGVSPVWQKFGMNRRDVSMVLLKDSNGKYITEQPFKFPYRAEPSVNAEFILSGKVDMLARRESEYCFVDIKTTSTWDVKEYLDAYRQSPQLKWYYMVIQKVADMFPETFGMFKNCKCFIDGVFLRKSLTESAEFHRSELFSWQPWEMEQFEEHVNQFINSIVYELEKGLSRNPFPKNIVACTAFPYGGCGFKEVCRIGCGEPEDSALALEDALLRKYYVKREYNPMNHGGITLEPNNE